MLLRSTKQCPGGFTCCASFNLKKKTKNLRIRCLSTFPFYRWGNWLRLEALMKLLVCERDVSWWVNLSIQVNVVGKGIVCLDCWGKKSTSNLLIKKKNKIKYVT